MKKSQSLALCFSRKMSKPNRRSVHLFFCSRSVFIKIVAFVDKKIIVCLDEVDRLDDFDLLYLLARSGCGLILMSTRCHVLASLTSRKRSSLALTEIEFPAYKTDELCDIIRDRVEFAIRPNSLKNEFIKLASVAAQGDARTGLEIVRKAGKKAEAGYLNEVTM
jgi:Cdc6-like AAA superfamily ATPase